MPGYMRSSGGGAMTVPDRVSDAVVLKIIERQRLQSAVAAEAIETTRFASTGKIALLVQSQMYADEAMRFGRARRVEVREIRQDRAIRFICEDVPVAHLVHLTGPNGLSGESWCGLVLGGGRRWSGVRAHATCTDCKSLVAWEAPGYRDE